MRDQYLSTVWATTTLAGSPRMAMAERMVAAAEVVFTARTS
jgi:hypothetical protein